MRSFTIIAALIGSALAAPVAQLQGAGLGSGLTELVQGVGETTVLTANNVLHGNLNNKRQVSGLVPELSTLLNGETLEGLVKRQEEFLEGLREVADRIPFVEMPDMESENGGVHALNGKRQEGSAPASDNVGNDFLANLRELADDVPFVEMPDMAEGSNTQE